MKQKMFMATIMIIVLALGLLGQAASAKAITTSPYEPAPAGRVIVHPFPGVTGGVPNLCSYSSIIANYYTFKCATDVDYSPSGFHATGSRTFYLNLYEDIDLTDLRSYIDNFAKTYSYYRAALDKFLKDWNMSSVTWDDLNNYANTRSKIGSDASQVLTEWKFVESDLEDINHFIDAWIL